MTNVPALAQPDNQPPCYGNHLFEGGLCAACNHPDPDAITDAPASTASEPAQPIAPMPKEAS